MDWPAAFVIVGTIAVLAAAHLSERAIKMRRDEAHALLEARKLYHAERMRELPPHLYQAHVERGWTVPKNVQPEVQKNLDRLARGEPPVLIEGVWYTRVNDGRKR